MNFCNTSNMSYSDIQQHFEQLSRKLGLPIKPDEGYINHCGYVQLLAGNLKSAYIIFKQNIQCYPHSFNVYDSMGEVCLAMGEKGLAILNYEKSIAMNPNHLHGRKMLKKLKA